jgi:DMSO/TMAO reductase YedYZ molybdopterin-dependent catalytic subunit
MPERRRQPAKAGNTMITRRGLIRITRRGLIRITRRGLIRVAGPGALAAGAGAMLSRHFLPGTAAAAGLELPRQLPEGTRQEALLDALPGKKPLIKLSYRPPNYETPLELLRGAITENDAFFVRYHLSDIPELDVRNWRLAVGGDGVGGVLSLTLDDLKRMPAVETVAVCQLDRNVLDEAYHPDRRGDQAV